MRASPSGGLTGGPTAPSTVRGIRFEAFGARIGIRVLDPALEPVLDLRLPPGATLTHHRGEVDTRYTVGRRTGGGSGDGPRYVLERDGEAVETAPTLAAIASAIEADLHFRVAVSARGWIFVHAGAVGWRGRSILIPGRTRTGKSSLVMALVRAGATYYSDEYAVLDPAGLVHPYAKPLSQRREDGSVRLIPPDELGSELPVEPLPVGLVLLTRYETGASWRPVERSRADCVMALFDNTVVAQLDPEFALNVITASVAAAIGAEGPRGEAGATAKAVLEYAEGATAG